MTRDGGPGGGRPPPRRAGLLLWLGFCAAVAGLVLALHRAFPDAIRTRDGWASVVYLSGVAALVFAGLFRLGRGMRPRQLSYAAVWIAVIAALALVFSFREEMEGVGRRLKAAASGGEAVAVGERERDRAQRGRRAGDRRRPQWAARGRRRGSRRQAARRVRRGGV